MTKLRIGYNTCGFARTNDLTDVIETIHTLGYDGMELTLDRGHFHPYISKKSSLSHFADLLSARDLALVLNTGGRYALSDEAHEPSLVSNTAAKRKEFAQFVEDTIHIAPVLRAQVVMLHSGILSKEVEPEQAWEWLFDDVSYLSNIASDEGITLGFEFHPDMFIANLEDYWTLKHLVISPALKLTLDVGHVVCTESRPVSQVISENKGEIANVHLEDIKGRKHVHLPIGQGDIDFVDVFEGLRAIEYTGLINIEFNTNDMEVDECQLARETLFYLKQLM